MANSLTSNTSTVVKKMFLAAVESSRVLSKTVNTTTVDGIIAPDTGSTAYVKRPHSYHVHSTSNGDLTGLNSPIVAGRAAATVQNMLSVPISWTSVEEATSLDQLEQIINPAAQNIVTAYESALGTFMLKSLGNTLNTPTAVADTWEEVALAGAMLNAVGAPVAGEKYYVMNPFTQTKLAGVQSGLNAADSLVRTAWENSQLSGNFGGLRGIASNALKSFTSTTAADRAGALSAAPTQTYVSVKDSMTQDWAVTGFSAAATLKAGDTLEVTGRYLVNPQNGEVIRNSAGAAMKFRAIVTADVLLDGAGAGTVTVTGPAIYESAGAYNTVDSALAQNDVVTLITATATNYQPNLYYHRDAIGITSVTLPKLYNTEYAQTSDGAITIRITRYSDGTVGTNNVRFDVLPVFSCFNPFWGGQAYGV